MGKERIYATVSETVDVEVDLVEACEDLTDREKERLLRILGASEERDSDLYVTRAYEALKGGRPAEAFAYLESYLFPALHIRLAAAAKRAKDLSPSA